MANRLPGFKYSRIPPAHVIRAKNRRGRLAVGYRAVSRRAACRRNSASNWAWRLPSPSRSCFGVLRLRSAALTPTNCCSKVNLRCAIISSLSATLSAAAETPAEAANIGQRAGKPGSEKSELDRWRGPARIADRKTSTARCPSGGAPDCSYRQSQRQLIQPHPICAIMLCTEAMYMLPVTVYLPEVAKLEWENGCAYGMAYKRLGWADSALQGWRNHVLFERALGLGMAGQDAFRLHIAELLNMPPQEPATDDAIGAAIGRLCAAAAKGDADAAQLAETAQSLMGLMLDWRKHRGDGKRSRAYALIRDWQAHRNGLYVGAPKAMQVGPDRVFALTPAVAERVLRDFLALKPAAEGNSHDEGVAAFLTKWGLFYLGVNFEEDVEFLARKAHSLTEKATVSVEQLMAGAALALQAPPGYTAQPFAFSLEWFWRFHRHAAAWLNHDGVGAFLPNGLRTLFARTHHTVEAITICESSHALICAALHLMASRGAAWRQCERTFADGSQCQTSFLDTANLALSTKRVKPSARTPQRYCSPRCRNSANTQMTRSRQAT